MSEPIENLFGSSTEFPMTWHSSVAAGDAVVGNADGNVYSLKNLGLQKVSEAATAEPRKTDWAELAGGRVIEVSGNASDYPTFSIRDAGGKEVVASTVLTVSSLCTWGIRVTALSNGNAFVFWLDYSTTPWRAVVGPDGSIVFAAAQIANENWYNGANVVARKPVQLSGGNVVVIGSYNVGQYVRGCELSAAGAILTGPINLPDIADSWLDDPVASPTGNRWAYTWMNSTSGGACRIMTTALTSVYTSGYTGGLNDVCHDFDSSGNYWWGYVKTSATATVYAGCVPAGTTTWLSAADLAISSTTANITGHIRGKCTGDNKFVVACPSVSTVGVAASMAHGVVELNAAANAILRVKYLTEVPVPIGDQYVAASSAWAVGGRDDQAAAKLANGDVVFANNFYVGSWNRMMEEMYIHVVRIGRDGSLIKNKLFQPGVSFAAQPIYRHALAATKSLLILGQIGKSVARAYFTPGAPVLGAASTAGNVTQSGKHTSTGATLPIGQTLSDTFSVFDHPVKAVFISATDYVLGA